MTIQDFELQQLLAQLGTSPVPAETEQRSERRRRVIHMIESRASRVYESHRLLHLWRRRAVFLSAAASIVMVGIGWAALRFYAAAILAPERHAGHVQIFEGQAQVGRSGHYRSISSGASDLSRYDTVATTAGSRAQVVLSSEVRIELSEKTQLRLGEVADRNNGEVWLHQGKAHFSVAKRAPSGSFSVHAPDADVTVVGTAFTVDVEQLTAGTRTSVTVTEGVVLVRWGNQVTRLGAGDAWTSRVASDTPVSEPPRIGPMPSVEATAVNNTHRRESAPQSTLHAENLAFSEAMSAKRMGNDVEALAHLDAFLTRYPTSPLSQNARVERFRLLKRLGRSDEASSAALEYMTEHPEGFARGEARSLAIPSSTPDK